MSLWLQKEQHTHTRTHTCTHTHTHVHTQGAHYATMPSTACGAERRQIPARTNKGKRKKTVGGQAHWVMLFAGHDIHACVCVCVRMWERGCEHVHACVWQLVCVCVRVRCCLTSQQHASVSQGRICSDNFSCCHTEIEVADPTLHLPKSQYTDTGPTSPSTDPIMPGPWQGSHWSANF